MIIYFLTCQNEDIGLDVENLDFGAKNFDRLYYFSDDSNNRGYSYRNIGRINCKEQFYYVEINCKYLREYDYYTEEDNYISWFW